MEPMKAYRPRKDIFWWLRNKQNFFYILREMSSFFLGLYTLFLMAFFLRGRLALPFFSNAVFMGFSVVALMFALLHSFTWFSLAPRAMPLYLADKKVPNFVVTLSYYVLFSAISALFLVLIYWK